MRRGRFQILSGLVLLAAAVPLLAQTYHGGLRGAVRESGGVIPGVSVTLTNEATNVSRTTTSNHAGEYAFVNVDPGTYTVKVAMQGFKTIDNKGIRIGTETSFSSADSPMRLKRIHPKRATRMDPSRGRPSFASCGRFGLDERFGRA